MSRVLLVVAISSASAFLISAFVNWYYGKPDEE